MLTITRRAALKSIVAGIASLLVHPVPRPRIDLMAWCGDDSRKYDMSLPFVQEDWTYATNSHVAVRVRPEAADRRESEKQLPPATNLPWDHDQLSGWKPLRPQVEHTAMGWCPTCEGIGWVGNVHECQTCEGMGCDECHDAGSVGDAVCGQCGGKNVWGRHSCIVQLESGLYVGAPYFRKLQGLGDVDYVVLPTRLNTSPGRRYMDQQPVIRFRFDGGTGLMIPVASDVAERRIADARIS